MNSTVYVGIRNDFDTVRVFVINGSTKTPLVHYVRHSPDGFNWGYEGSGPTDLAECILADTVGKEMLLRPEIYQQFKRDIISPIVEDEWCLPQEVVKDWYDDYLEN
jgi:hypothetical protein